MKKSTKTNAQPSATEDLQTNGSTRVAMVSRNKTSKGMADYLAEHKPTEMSVQEKDMLSILLPEMPELPYPTHALKMAYGPDAVEYDIPDDKREEVLKELFPFENTPAMDEKLFDIHERKYFTTREYKVIRERDRNMLVSPYYPITGGMVVDWLPDEATDTFVQKATA